MVKARQLPAEWLKLDGHEDSVCVFAIYELPLDHPRHFVVRRWFTASDGKIYADVVPRLADSLEEARGLVPSGLACLTSQPEDDPTICETWV